MLRRGFVMGMVALGVAACEPRTRARIGPDGLPLPTLYRITPEDERQIPFRMLDSVNALRASAGAPAVQLDSLLNAAAATHARDMSLQNRPWHFGSDGSSPIDRLRRVGYQGNLVGEVIAETFETELVTLAAWMENPVSRPVILDPAARRMGLAWHQEAAGKIWWSMVFGA